MKKGTRASNVAESKGLTIKDIKRIVKRAIKRHGLFGLLLLSAERIVKSVCRLRPSVKAALRESIQRAEAFDKQFGVDTIGHIPQTELDVNNPNQIHAVAYGGSDPEPFRRAIGTLPIDFHRFTFVDFGSGKGRAILLATEFPFKKIIGVEFSPELHLIACENIKGFRSDIIRCNEVESICSDAVDYLLPDDCLVCYFCNPFDATIMAQVLSNINKSLLRNPREIIIAYYNPKEGHLIDAASCFIRVGTIGPIRVWKTTLQTQRRAG